MATKVITDYSEIRRFIEERGGEPAIVRGVVEDEEMRADILEVAFRDSAKKDLERVSWSEFFDRLERGNLVLVYDDGEEDRKPAEFRFVQKEEAMQEYAPDEEESTSLPDSGDPEALKDNVYPDSGE
ncbi:hypothetical protein KW797_01580 [Candidatus Parcubacteria bacterium]|nr:hypothetical protein [Candidatus Parcubacteria bacterium]